MSISDEKYTIGYDAGSKHGDTQTLTIMQGRMVQALLHGRNAIAVNNLVEAYEAEIRRLKANQTTEKG